MEGPLLKNVENGHIIPIVKTPFVIGRGLTCDYVIASKVVSRAHCSFEKTDQGWVLRDLSTNGTMINEEIYKSTCTPVLKENDEICLGYQAFTYIFLLNPPRMRNFQMDRLKIEEGSNVLSNIVRSQGTPNNFDEDGISDDMLNKMADEILCEPPEPVSEVVTTSDPPKIKSIESSESIQKQQQPRTSAEDASLSNILDFVLDNQTRIDSDPTANVPSTSSRTSLTDQATELRVRQVLLEKEVLKRKADLLALEEYMEKRYSAQPSSSRSTSTSLENTTSSSVTENNSVTSFIKNQNKKLKIMNSVPEGVEGSSTVLLSTADLPKVKMPRTPNGKVYPLKLTEDQLKQQILNNNQESNAVSLISVSKTESPIRVPSTGVHDINQVVSKHFDSAIPSTSGMTASVSSITKVADKENSGTDGADNTKVTADNETTNKSKQASDQKHFEEMEDELMCTICANLFVKPVTLGCSHSFCQYCIDMWKKKKSVCPICRNRITSTNRTLVLDNIIGKMLESAPQEMRDQRQQALAERAKIDADIAAAKASSRNSASSRSTTRRGRSRATRNRARQDDFDVRVMNLLMSGSAPTTRVPLQPPVIELDSSSESPTDTDEDYMLDDYQGDEWDSNGVPGAYYGGYGRCYNCGDPGHWANGCPYR